MFFPILKHTPLSPLKRGMISIFSIENRYKTNGEPVLHKESRRIAIELIKVWIVNNLDTEMMQYFIDNK